MAQMFLLPSLTEVQHSPVWQKVTSRLSVLMAWLRELFLKKEKRKWLGMIELFMVGAKATSYPIFFLNEKNEFEQDSIAVEKDGAITRRIIQYDLSGVIEELRASQHQAYKYLYPLIEEVTNKDRTVAYLLVQALEPNDIGYRVHKAHDFEAAQEWANEIKNKKFKRILIYESKHESLLKAA